MNTEKIRKEIRTSIRKRMPITFEGLFEDTFETLSGKYWYIDRKVIQQQVAMELLLNFRKRLSTKEICRLEKIRRDSEKARQEAKFETINI